MTPPSPAIAFHPPPSTRTLLASVALRGDKKKQTSRCNLRVRWVFDQPPHAAIAFSRWETCDGAALFFIGATLTHGSWLRQLPLAGDGDGFMNCALGARSEPDKLAVPYCHRVLRPCAHVLGAGGRSRSRVGRTGKTAYRLFPAGKKCDLVRSEVVLDTEVIIIYGAGLVRCEPPLACGR